jgi:hypothetical protein
MILEAAILAVLWLFGRAFYWKRRACVEPMRS